MHQRKYALELISEIGLSGSRPTTTPMNRNIKLTKEYDQHVKKSSYQMLTRVKTRHR